MKIDVLMQVEWNEGGQALLVWCVLQCGLGSQSLTITQAYQVGTELGLFAKPANGS